MMHELAVTESILEIATQAAIEHAATKVTDIYLTLGQLSSIVDESVQFYWDAISQGNQPDLADAQPFTPSHQSGRGGGRHCPGHDRL